MQGNQTQKMQTPTEMLDNMLANKLLNTPFKCTLEARKHISIIQLWLSMGAISLDQLCPNKATFDHLYDLGQYDELSLLDASYFLNCAGKLIPSTIGMNIPEYKQFLANNDKAVVEWNEIVMPIKTSSMREIEAKLTRKIINPYQNMKIIKR